jgi:2-keto-4-pentenoate hydratase/2-oxohepta-3-ene-1,7-dioic acid hydratase in catechol pathway
VGLVDGDRIYDLRDQPSLLSSGTRMPSSVDEVLASGALSRLNSSKIDPKGGSFEIVKAKLLTPVLAPQKILLAAVNYIAHGKEQNVKPPTEPYFFTKFNNTLVADGEPILIPPNSSKVDWEVEVAAIVGKKGKYIPKSKAFE